MNTAHRETNELIRAALPKGTSLPQYKHVMNEVFRVLHQADVDAGELAAKGEKPSDEFARKVTRSAAKAFIALTNVLVSWNCSAEQARTIALAKPLLQKADRVTVLTVVRGTGVLGPSSEQLIRYLQRNDIAPKLLTVELNGRNTGEVILATAESLGCDLLIKGAYTLSPLRQMIFGGATQHILANAPLPVLLAH